MKEPPKRSGGIDFGATYSDAAKKPSVTDYRCMNCGRELPPFSPRSDYIRSDNAAEFLTIDSFNCPFCRQLHATMVYVARREDGKPVSVRRTIFPVDRGRRVLPPGLPEAIEHEYREAAAIFEISPRASAAMSRRCLQSVLREVAGSTKERLDKAIDEVIGKGVLPGELARELDAVRVIGNFGAHPMKAEATGVILDVEPGEAEWNLEVLEDLFDFYFKELPARQARRDALNQKLRDAGRKPLE